MTRWAKGRAIRVQHPWIAQAQLGGHLRAACRMAGTEGPVDAIGLGLAKERAVPDAPPACTRLPPVAMLRATSGQPGRTDGETGAAPRPRSAPPEPFT